MAINIDTGQILFYALTAGKSIALLVLGGVALFTLWYWLFVLKNRRIWIAEIYEKQPDGSLQLVGKDTVIERKINKGKQVVYVLKKAKVEVMPPNWKATRRLNGKQYAKYLRYDLDYLPITESVEPVSKEIELDFLKRMKKETKDIKKMSVKEVESKYLFAPLSQTLQLNLVTKPIPYDINMMRINAIDNRDKIYADKRGFWEKYGTYFVIGGIVVLIIVVMYMSYDYSSNVINTVMAKVEHTLTVADKVADKLGGTQPPS